MWAEEAKPHTFVAAPKPDNFDVMAAAWNDPIKFGIEVAKYRAQVADFWVDRAAHRADRGWNPKDDA